MISKKFSLFYHQLLGSSGKGRKYKISRVLGGQESETLSSELGCPGTRTALCPPPVSFGGNGLLCSECMQSIFIRPLAFVSLSVSSNRVQIGKEEEKKVVVAIY